MSPIVVPAATTTGSISQPLRLFIAAIPLMWVLVTAIRRHLVSKQRPAPAAKQTSKRRRPVCSPQTKEADPVSDDDALSSTSAGSSERLQEIPSDTETSDDESRSGTGIPIAVLLSMRPRPGETPKDGLRAARVLDEELIQAGLASEVCGPAAPVSTARGVQGCPAGQDRRTGLRGCGSKHAGCSSQDNTRWENLRSRATSAQDSDRWENLRTRAASAQETEDSSPDTRPPSTAAIDALLESWSSRSSSKGAASAPTKPIGAPPGLGLCAAPWRRPADGASVKAGGLLSGPTIGGSGLRPNFKL